MWEFEHIVDAGVTPAQVWSCYANAEVWPEFDQGLERVTLDGPFAVGTHGTLLARDGDPRGREPLPFVLVHAVKDGGFTAETRVSDTVTIRFVHRLAALPGGGTRITHGVEIDGPGAEEFGPQLGPGVTGVIPDIVATLVRVATLRAAD